VIGPFHRSRKHEHEVFAAIDAAALPEDVCIAGDALVEKHLSPLDAETRKDMQVRDMRDAEHSSIPFVPSAL
jgi:hypothetical protein